MKYRGVEYYVAQGVEVGTWKFSTSMNDKIRTVRAKSRQEAAKVVERWIEEALAPKKRGLRHPLPSRRSNLSPPKAGRESACGSHATKVR